MARNDPLSQLLKLKESESELFSNEMNSFQHKKHDSPLAKPGKRPKNGFILHLHPSYSDSKWHNILGKYLRNNIGKPFH